VSITPILRESIRIAHLFFGIKLTLRVRIVEPT